METIDSLLGNTVFRFFYEICQIPHGSGNEFELGKWIVTWALKEGLYAEQDTTGNILIKRVASALYAKSPSVMIQAHLDMVCVSRPDYKHDFYNDSIKWSIDGDLLSTGHTTTLGADNGIGIALAMAILIEKAELPEIVVLLTVGEEDDFRGVSRLSNNWLRSNLLINLDHFSENEVLCGSCGGMQVNCSIPLNKNKIPTNYKAYRLTLSGLRGGHSGIDIDKGCENAIVLLARMIQSISHISDCLISSFRGGSFRLAIPHDAEAVICIPEVSCEVAQRIIERSYLDFCEEMFSLRKQIQYTFEELPLPDEGVQSKKVIFPILLLPDGIFKMSDNLIGQVVTSDNLGEVYFREDNLDIVLEIRSEYDSLSDYLFERMNILASIFGGECRKSNRYPSWHYNPDSWLVNKCISVHNALYDKPMNCSMVHAGLEVGYFFEKVSGLDAVSIGPDIFNAHSIDESVSISSVQRFYAFLKELLIRL